MQRDAKQGIFEYMEVFYNRQWLQLTLGYAKPAGDERIANAG